MLPVHNTVEHPQHSLGRVEIYGPLRDHILLDLLLTSLRQVNHQRGDSCTVLAPLRCIVSISSIVSHPALSASPTNLQQAPQMT